MILQQHYLGCLAQASYLIGDEESGTAVVVDPRRDVDLYVGEARALGLEIRHVVLTHFHADFLAGHLELRALTEATIHLGAEADAEFDFVPMEDGAELRFGEVLLRFLETPGHTPESVSVLVFDLAVSSERPHAVLTGDTLFIGDVGRPDLMASVGVTAEELAGRLYDSLHDKLLALPDETLVYPGHGAGSMCGKNLSSETVSTIGAQRRLNYALQPMSRADFVALVTADQPAAPAYFGYDAALNKKVRPTLGQSLRSSLRPLSLDAALEQVALGAQLLDTRDPDEFATRHMAGSLNIGLGGKYATWAGTLLDHERPIVIVAGNGREEEAAIRLGRIGYDNLSGYLEGGIAALAERPDLLRELPRVDVTHLNGLLDCDEPPLLVDVRQPGEWESGHIDGAVHVPLTELAARFEELPRDRPIVLQCQGGYRSMIAASLLSQRGYEQLSDLIGGYSAWTESGRPVTTPVEV